MMRFRRDFRGLPAHWKPRHGAISAVFAGAKKIAFRNEG
jgi:hypothetical protein